MVTLPTNWNSIIKPCSCMPDIHSIPMMAPSLSKIHRSILQRISRPLNEADLARSAIIFSPHQDDETLACGGTIALKRKLGAGVRIAWLTEGSRSHSRYISRSELKEIRAQEAIAASEVLGVDRSELFFLEFEDSRLHKYKDTAANKVLDLLKAYRPGEVFIPYAKEAPSDHRATNQIVRMALQQYQSEIVVNEYPVWFWGHWPWVSYRYMKEYEPKFIRVSLRNALGFQLLKDFRISVQIESVLPRKLQALERYKTQMTRYLSETNWPILSDISRGEFLACFFQNTEVFHRYNFLPVRSTSLSF